MQKFFKIKLMKFQNLPVIFCLLIFQYSAAASEHVSCNMNTLEQDSIARISAGQFEKAAELFTVCINENPQNALLYNNRANIYKRMKRYDEAVADYDKAIQLDKNYITPYNGKTGLYLVQGKFTDALKISDKIIKIQPKNASAYYNKGLIHLAQDDSDAALKSFKTAVKYDSNNFPSAYYYIGGLTFKQKNYKEAVLNYEKCLDVIKQNSGSAETSFSAGDVYYNLGMSYFKLNNYQQAFNNLLRAAKTFGEEGRTSDEDAAIDFIKKNFDVN